MIRRTIQIGHPALTSTNTPISDFFSKKVKQVIEDLTDTMRKNGLIGMAAPQIRENYQIFVTEPRETITRPKEQTNILRIYMNPKIVAVSDKQIFLYEGCGSVLNGKLFGPVKRPETVTVEAFDESGKKFGLTTDGILARVILHEYDHLQGVDFLEKVSDYKQMMTLKYYLKNIKPDPIYAEAAKIRTIKKIDV